MKRSIINKCLIGIGILSMASCSDPMEEITDIIFDREFSPTNLEVKNVKETSALLKWKASTSVSEYTVELYPDDSLTFTSTPISVNIAENEMQLENLTYDTRYSVKVIAKDTKNPSRNSKAATLFFRTGAQQIFKAIEEDNIGDRSVVVSWAEEEKDVSEIRAFDQTGALIATHTITDAEKNSGTAKVDGLSPETKYTLKLYYNSNGVLKERGSKTFTTIVDLDGAILVRPTDDIADLVANAKDGDVFALTGGLHLHVGSGAFIAGHLDAGVTVRAGARDGTGQSVDLEGGVIRVAGGDIAEGVQSEFRLSFSRKGLRRETCEAPGGVRMQHGPAPSDRF